MVFNEALKGIYIVLTTEANRNKAYKIANSLLNEKLIPCVSFKNIESHFWWEGKISKLKEVQLIIKCKEENINKVCKKISEKHSYDVPEIICLPVSTTKEYYRWMDSV